MFRPAYLIRCVNCSKIKNFLSRSVLLMQPTPLCFTQYCRSHLLLKQGKQLCSLLVMKFCSICRHLSSTQPPTSLSLNIHCRYCQTAFAMRPSLSEMYCRDLTYVAFMKLVDVSWLGYHSHQSLKSHPLQLALI